MDVRESAILMLFAVYALRAREVARLRLDDMDWEKELGVTPAFQLPSDGAGTWFSKR